MSPDKELTQREKRMQRHKQQVRKDMPKIALKKAKKPLMIIGILALVSGAIAGMVAVSNMGPDCPGHWHARQFVIIEDDRVEFDHPSFLSGTKGYHIHDDTGILHTHPAVERCVEFKRWEDHLDYHITEDKLVLGDKHGVRAGEYPIGGDKELRIYYEDWQGEWQRISIDKYHDMQFDNGARVLVTYGTLTEELVQRQLASMPVMPAGYAPEVEQEPHTPHNNTTA